MSPCSPNDVSLTPPTISTAPAIPGFGIPSAPKLPQISVFPNGFPEDLLDLFNRLQFLIPPGAIKPPMSMSNGKDIFDGLMKMLDQFFPFLMMFKFVIPILNIIICVIEICCALMNPFALINAINNLFSKCLLPFLNMFPIFALIVAIISLLLLLLALIEYIISQILSLVQRILRNINALNNAFMSGDANGVLAIAQKLGALLCVFQNLFVLFSIFEIIIDVIRDILNMAFNIPPCQSGGSGDTNSCCTPETCPEIVQGPYTRFTGTFKYFPEIGIDTGINLFGTTNLTSVVRQEMTQFFDGYQTPAQAFSNIYDAIDITNTSPKPVFFPTDSTYTATLDIRQAPYLLDLRMFYNPAAWGRKGTPRYVRFTNCIMQSVPTPNLVEVDDSVQTESTGVIILVGGAGYEDNGTTILNGYAADGVTEISAQATLGSFFHIAPTFDTSTNFVAPKITDGVTIYDVEYTFRPNIAPLLQKGIVTVGCVPSIALNKAFINNVMSSNIGLMTAQLQNLLNSTGTNSNGEPNVFPNPAAAQECMTTALASLRTNMTVEGVAEFQTTCNLCLSQLQSDATSALNSMIGIGIAPCSSSFTITPTIQFTTQPVIVSVSINETNGISLTNNLPASVASSVASSIKLHTTFGVPGTFTYDGSQFFTAPITSDVAGSGEVMVSFDNQIFCTNTLSATASPTHTLQTQSYTFIFTPVSSSGTISGASGTTSVGDSDGQPRRDAGDVSREGDD